MSDQGRGAAGEQGAAKYAAFISYSHSNEVFARRFHSRLEGYRLPKALIGSPGKFGPLGARVGRVFRDRDEFAAGGELKQEIEAALQQSQALIVLCSAASASSRYVNEEVAFFEALPQGGRIIPVIVSDEPPDCFPPRLRNGAERLGADAREGGDGFDSAVLKVIAGLVGVSHDALVQREQVRQRRRARLGAGLVLVFATLAVGASVMAAWALREQARSERIASRSLDIAASMMDETAGLSATLGVRRESVGAMLDRSRTLFDQLFDERIDSPRLLIEQAQLSLAYYDHYRRLGLASQQREAAMRALSLIESVRRPQDANVRLLSARAHMAAADAEATGGEGQAALDRLDRVLSQELDEGFDWGELSATRNARAAEVLERIGQQRSLAGQVGDALEALQAADALWGASAAGGERELGRARTRLALGRLLAAEGEGDRADEQLLSAEVGLTSLLQIEPANADAMRTLSSVHAEIAAIANARGDPTRAATSSARAHALMQRLLALDPSDHTVATQFARAQVEDAKIAMARGDLSGALSRAQEARDLTSALFSRAPQVQEFAYLQFDALDVQMAVAMDRSDAQFNDVLAATRRLTEQSVQFQGVADYKWRQARALRREAEWRRRNGELSIAAARANAALGLVSGEHETGPIAVERGAINLVRGRATLDAGRPADAADLFAASMRSLEAANAANPRDLELQVMTIEAMYWRVNAQRTAGQRPDALEEFRRIRSRAATIVDAAPRYPAALELSAGAENNFALALLTTGDAQGAARALATAVSRAEQARRLAGPSKERDLLLARVLRQHAEVGVAAALSSNTTMQSALRAVDLTEQLYARHRSDRDVVFERVAALRVSGDVVFGLRNFTQATSAYRAALAIAATDEGLWREYFLVARRLHAALDEDGALRAASEHAVETRRRLMRLIQAFPDEAPLREELVFWDQRLAGRGSQ